MEPFKKLGRTANNVSVIKLLPDKNRVTLLIVASDGLWDAVEKQPHKESSFSNLVANFLNLYGHAPNANQILSDYLTRWSGSLVSDDITIAVSNGIPTLNLKQGIDN